MKYALGIAFCMASQYQLYSLLNLDQKIDLSMPISRAYFPDVMTDLCKVNQWRNDLELRIQLLGISNFNHECNKINCMEPSSIVPYSKRAIAGDIFEDCLFVVGNKVHSWREERIVFENDIQHHDRTIIVPYKTFFIVISIARSPLGAPLKTVTLQLMQFDSNQSGHWRKTEVELFSFHNLYDCPFWVAYINDNVIVCSSPSGRCFVIKNWDIVHLESNRYNIKHDIYMLGEPIHSVREFKEQGLVLVTTYGIKQLLLTCSGEHSYESDAFAGQTCITRECIRLLLNKLPLESFQIIREYNPRLRSITCTVQPEKPWKRYSHKALVLLLQLERQCSLFQNSVCFMRLDNVIPELISLHKDWIAIFNELPLHIRLRYKNILLFKHYFDIQGNITD